MQPGNHPISRLSVAELEQLAGNVCNLIVTGSGDMYFNIKFSRYYIDRVKGKSELPKEITGGLLEFPDPKKPESVRGRILFQKTCTHYVLAIASMNTRQAYALATGRVKG